MNDIEYIEIMTTNYARYKIFSDNILEFNCNISGGEKMEKITENIYNIGVSDKNLDLFESQYKVPNRNEL